jgi:hypothetical protein
MFLWLKIVISAVLIGLISEISRRNTAIAALLAALPLVSLISMIWMQQETGDAARIAAFSWSVFWYVLPSLVLFVLVPTLLLRWHLPFYAALFLAGAATIAVFFAMKAVLLRFGVQL